MLTHCADFGYRLSPRRRRWHRRRVAGPGRGPGRRRSSPSPSGTGSGRTPWVWTPPLIHRLASGTNPSRGGDAEVGEIAADRKLEDRRAGRVGLRLEARASAEFELELHVLDRGIGEEVAGLHADRARLVVGGVGNGLWFSTGLGWGPRHGLHPVIGLLDRRTWPPRRPRCPRRGWRLRSSSVCSGSWLGSLHSSGSPPRPSARAGPGQSRQTPIKVTGNAAEADPAARSRTSNPPRRAKPRRASRVRSFSRARASRPRTLSGVVRSRTPPRAGSAPPGGRDDRQAGASPAVGRSPRRGPPSGPRTPTGRIGPSISSVIAPVRSRSPRCVDHLPRPMGHAEATPWSQGPSR